MFFIDLFNRTFFKDRYKYLGVKSIPSCGKNSLWLPEDALTFDLEVARQQNWIHQYSNFKPPTIDKEKESFALSQLREVGLPKDAWFVCLHVPQTKDRLNIRQSNIDNYLMAIRYITDQGGWVIRIGDSNNPELPELDNVIDYAHNEENHSIVNLYAISKCKFFIGVTSGPSLVASLFRVFVVGTNRTQLAHDYPFNLSIIKHVYDTKLKK
ncbi:TIGR04372 family glycosyltransferase, partial [Gammaproteobacteria bacterium]|nr:TIGR04372 family glycosyltransferase [Gammaproteobacteria bacterium]